MNFDDLKETAKILFASPILVWYESGFLPYRMGLYKFQLQSLTNDYMAVQLLKQIYISGRCDKEELLSLIERVPALYSKLVGESKLNDFLKSNEGKLRQVLLSSLLDIKK